MEEPKQTCQCVSGADRDDPCHQAPDPSTGEALLCWDCWNSPTHREANMVPKLLPKRALNV